MKIAIVGSRNYPNLDLVRAYVSRLGETPGAYTIVSGGAPGVDTVAEETAREYGIAVEIYPVTKEEWEKYGKSAGPMRNAKIVEAAGFVIAFWDGQSPGTLDTIRKATLAGKRVVIYGPQCVVNRRHTIN